MFLMMYFVLFEVDSVAFPVSGGGEFFLIQPQISDFSKEWQDFS